MFEGCMKRMTKMGSVVYLKPGEGTVTEEKTKGSMGRRFTVGCAFKGRTHICGTNRQDRSPSRGGGVRAVNESQLD